MVRPGIGGNGSPAALAAALTRALLPADPWLHVRLPPDRNLDVLALCGAEEPMLALLRELRQQGFAVDVAGSLPQARRAFEAAGGHHCLLVAPDVAPGLALSVLQSLRVVDPDLPAVTFGPALAVRRGRRQATRLGFHPGSRAGLGALLRFLRSLPERG